MRSVTRSLVAALVASLTLAALADGPVPPGIPMHDVEIGIDSGWVENTTVDGPAVVWSAEVHVPDAEWLRLWFEDVQLSGNVEEPDHTILRITSIWDGGIHYLNSLTAQQWAWSSAYMNGDTLLVEIIAHPDTGPSRLVIDYANAGDPYDSLDPASLCGADDRELSSDPRSARHMPIGCSAWLIDDTNHCFISAGHCSTGASDVMQFNVPLSNGNGSTVNPPPEDQYSVDPESVQQVNGGIGNDWGYFACFPNSNTNLTAFQAQGDFYLLADAAPPVSGQNIRITGYGTVSFPVSPTWNQVQKTHSGPYFAEFGSTVQYKTDTTGGNSGSAVEDESTGMAIGVHTNAGCESVGGNQGTSVDNGGWQNALDNPQGLCAGGDDAPLVAPVYLATDSMFNFGNIDFEESTFGNISNLGELIQGLAFNPSNRTFYATTAGATPRLLAFDDKAESIDDVGPLSGVLSDTIYGLAFDRVAGVLYGIDQTDGHLYTVDPDTAQASPIGAPAGGEVGAIAFNPDNNTLYGINDVGGSAKLVTIDTTTGAFTTIKTFGFSLKDFDGLAYNEDDGFLWTIRDTTDLPIRINPANGALTFFGSVGVSVGPVYGMAYAPAPCPADFNNDGAPNVLDFVAFQAAFEADDPDADINGDGSFDVLDFPAFQAIFAEGCP